MDLKLYEYDTPWGVRIRAYGREGTNDENTLISCLSQDEYEVGRLPVQGLAIDLGGHIGGSALALLARGYYVHIVEMFPENIDILKKNLEINGYSNQAMIWPSAVIGKRTGENIVVPAFYANTSTEAGQVHEFIGTLRKDKAPAGSIIGGGREIKVMTVTLDEILDQAKRCDFLKIDIEGAEWDVIKNTSPETLSKVKRIAVEIEGLGKITNTQEFGKFLPNFRDVSKEYFPLWSDPSGIVHGYFINEIYK